MFSPTGNKRQKIIKDTIKYQEINENFPSINKVEYKGISAQYDDILCYRYYNANEKIHGRTMEEWIRPAISFSSLKYKYITLNGKTIFHPNWNDSSIETYKRFINIGFEICMKLGIKQWTAYDKDILSIMEGYDENCNFFDDICDVITELQQKYSIKPLWIEPNFLYNPKIYKLTSGNNDTLTMIYMCQQIKKCMELNKKIGSECLPILRWNQEWNINIDVQKEIKHFARILKMTADYKDRLGFRGQLLLRSSNNECYFKTQHNFIKQSFFDKNNLSFINDPLSGLCFLKHFNLDHHYKLLVNSEHDYHLCLGYNTVGSFEIIKNKTSIRNMVLLMKSKIEQGGIQMGGINIQIDDTPTGDIKDVLTGYIKHIDALAKSLRITAKMLSDQVFMKNLQQRYLPFYSGFGSRLCNGEANLEECEEFAKKSIIQPNDYIGNNHECLEATFQNFIDSCNF